MQTFRRDESHWAELLKLSIAIVESSDRIILAYGGEEPDRVQYSVRVKTEAIATMARARKALGLPPLPI